jgi:hypothetical protein
MQWIREVWADREKKITQLPPPRAHTTRVKNQTAECVIYQTRKWHIPLIHVAIAARQNQRHDPQTSRWRGIRSRDP